MQPETMMKFETDNRKKQRRTSGGHLWTR